MAPQVHQLTELHFNRLGNLETPSQLDTLVAQLQERGIENLFLHAHGYGAGTGMFNDGYLKAANRALAMASERSDIRLEATQTMAGCAISWPASAWVDFPLVPGYAVLIANNGMARVIDRLKHAMPNLRVHMSGHSMGTVVAAVSCVTHSGPGSPIKSLFMMAAALDQGYVRSLRVVDGPVVSTLAKDDDMLKWVNRLPGQNPIGIYGMRNLGDEHEWLDGIDQVGAPLDFTSRKWWTVNIHSLVGSDHDKMVYEPQVAWYHLCASKAVKATRL